MGYEETIDVLEVLLRHLKLRGVQGTLNTLKIGKKTRTIRDPYDAFVVNMVLEKFNTTQEKIIAERYLRGENKYAIGFCVYYLYHNKTIGEIKRVFFPNRNKSLLSKYKQMIIDLKKTHEQDLKYIKIRDFFDKEIENYKTRNK